MQKSRLRRAFFVTVATAASAIFAYLSVRNVDFDVFWQGLRTSSYGWLVPSLAVLALGVFLRALRWRTLFPPATRPPVKATTEAVLVGYFFNNVLPARLGEAIRIVALHREAGTSRAEAAATTVAERVFDVVALLLLFFVLTPFLPHTLWLGRAAALAGVAFAGLVVAFVVLQVYGERPIRAMLRPLSRVPAVSTERVLHAATNVTRGFGALHRPSLAIPAFGLTMASWLVVAFSFWLALLGLQDDPTFGGALLILIATNLALLIPSLPASLGVFEAATVASLKIYDVDASTALATAVVIHAVNLFPYIVVGLLVIHRQARRGARRARPGVATEAAGTARTPPR